MRIRTAALLALVLGTTAVAACNDDSLSSDTVPSTTAVVVTLPGDVSPTSIPAPSEPPVQDPTIVISESTFSVNPAVIGVITVRNDDPIDHTVTAVDGSFDVTVPANSTVEFTVAKPGTYDFVCSLHTGMTGTLVVA